MIVTLTRLELVKIERAVRDAAGWADTERKVDELESLAARVSVQLEARCSGCQHTLRQHPRKCRICGCRLFWRSAELRG